MAKRPAWCLYDGHIRKHTFEFVWASMYDTSQNIKNLHKSISSYGTALEISTKSLQPFGESLSAFNLKYDDLYVESIYQSSKIYEMHPDMSDMLYMYPSDAKTDNRHKISGELLGFKYNDFIFTLDTGTAFYDFIYLNALRKRNDLDELFNYEWFTDIIFNSKKGRACQARSVVMYKILKQKGILHILDDVSKFRMYHKQFFNDIVW